MSPLAWEHLGIPQEEPESVAGERDVLLSLLDLLPQRPDLGLEDKNGWMDNSSPVYQQALLMNNAG